MKSQKLYEADDKLIVLIRDNYNVLQSLGSFGINLGFGDKTVNEVCEAQGVDTYTFLAIVNLVINGYKAFDDFSRLSIPTIMHYLHASHEYYLDFQLPYDEYAEEIKKHMKYEEKFLFPYVESLLDKQPLPNYDIDTFSKHHGQTDQKLRELKNIIIKYLPSNGLRNNQLSATLCDIYNNEEWLAKHSDVEEEIMIPAIRTLEKKLKQNDVSAKISSMINTNPGNQDALSEREKEVIVSLVQGMTNKEIANHLCIAPNTVITHRRNIARKLQIHTPAGLTIYAIVTNLVDISSVEI